jgi:hypothetical protein
MTITPDEVLAAVDAAVSRPAGKGNERDLNALAPHG